MTDDAERLRGELEAGSIPALARAISLVENGRPGFEALLSRIHPRVGRARRLGVTGPPGAGKSTLTDLVVRAWRTRGLRVAVVAIDPTSPYTGGALLGDRIRMEGSSDDPDVYIRSMATRGSLGGLATTTGEVADVLDAAGFDRIILETVGVGQSELDIAGTADTTLLVLVPESGDGIQTLKAGVMEAADVFAVNKGDRPGAERLVKELEVTLHLRQGQAYRGMVVHGAAPAVEPGWTPPVVTTVATEGDGVPDLIAALDRHWDWLETSGELTDRRTRRIESRTRAVVRRAIMRWGWESAQAEQAVRASLGAIAEGAVSPYDVAGAVVGKLEEG